MTWRLWIAGGCLLAVVAGGGCLGSGDDDDNGNGAAHVAFTTIFSSATQLVYTVRPDWSPDGSNIIFSGGPNAHVYRVAATAGASPVGVTNTASEEWEDWGYTPCVLADGRIAYYLGWIGDDHDMHIMAAGATQEEGVPAPVILHQFNGADVGMGQDVAGSPEVLSVSGDGSRAVVLWGSSTLYTLDWSGGPVAAVRLSDAIGGTIWDPVLSRDGERIVFVNGDHEIAWLPFAGGTPQVVGSGLYPSWSGDGELLGYVNDDFESYVVHDMSGGTDTHYSLSGASSLQYAALSWDGTKFAFRTFGGPNNGISVGTLVP